MVVALYSEARSEGKEGMQAVANVINERAKNKHYHQVILQDKQFSCFNNGWKVVKRDYKNYNHESDYKSLKTAIHVSFKLFTGQLMDNTKNATHYVKSGCKPYWIAEMDTTIVIKNHVFMK